MSREQGAMLKFSLRFKLLALCSLLSAGSVAVGMLGYFFMKQVTNKYSHVATVNLPKTRATENMLAEYRKVRIRLLSLGIEGVTQDVIEKSGQDVKSSFEAYDKARKEFTTPEFSPGIQFGPGEETLLKSTDEQWEKFKQLTDKMFQLVRSVIPEDRKKLNSMYYHECPDSAATYYKALHELYEYQASQSKEWVVSANEESSRSGAALVFGSLASLTLSLALGFLIVGWITRRLNSLAQSLGSTGAEIKTIVESLSGASQQLASSTQAQASSVDQVSSSLEEISAMVSSSLKSAQDSLGLSKNVSELVSSGSIAMSTLQEAVNQIAESNERVERLAKVIEEIGEKTELIDDIVFQTRLLSFNASVEAERAGEHGRGFAVVAQEVGNLAQMSGKSATEITQIVKNSIKEAQDVAHQNKARVLQGVTLCKETASKLESIHKASQEILSGSQQILRASEEQNSGIQLINQSIQTIGHSTQENAGSSEECAQSCEALAEQGRKFAIAVDDLDAVVYGASKNKGHGEVEPDHYQEDEYSRRPAKSAKVVPIRKSSASIQSRVQPRKNTVDHSNSFQTAGSKAIVQAVAPKEDAWEKL